MPFVDVAQNSVDWLHMRCAMVTASNMWKVMAKLKDPKKESAYRLNYKMDLVTETLTGRAAETYVSPAMEWGIDNEPLARAAYEMARDVEVLPGGFFIHDAIQRLGASPDGIVGEGLIEIKCPNTSTHIQTMLSGEIDENYRWQMTCQMACAKAPWVDFISFDPRMPKPMQMWVKRFPRDEKLIAAVETESIQILTEVIAIIKNLESACELGDLKAREHAAK